MTTEPTVPGLQRARVVMLLAITICACGGCSSTTDRTSCTTPTIAGDLVLTDDTAVGNAACIREVGGDVLAENATLTMMELASLETVGGSIRVDQAGALTGIRLPALQTIDGDLVVQIAFQLSELSVPSLTSVGGEIHLVDHRLAVLDFASLTSAGGINVKTLRCSSFELLLLSAVAGDLALSDNGGALLSFAVPQLQTLGGGLSIMFNSGLQDLDGLAALTRVDGDFAVQYNSVLPTCAANALRDQLLVAGGIGGTVTISGNDDTGTCSGT